LENITLQVYWDSAEKRKNPYYSLRGSEVPLQSEQFAYFDFTNRDNDVIGGNIYQKNMNSVFGRLSYDYNGKYLLEGSLNMTNLVYFKIAKGVTFLLYPQDGLFQKKAFGIMIQKISYLKLRGSWGQNGSDQFSRKWRYSSLQNSRWCCFSRL
jgi:hypothetical protein